MARPKLRKDITTKVLESLDLSENEAVLYGYMLAHPSTTVQELGTRAPFPRTMLYYVLKQLMTRGLVSAKKEGWRTVYVAENPERLYDLLAQKQREFEREADTLRDLIPRLKHRYHLSGKLPTVRMFEGLGEYAKALEDVLLTKPKDYFSYEVLGRQKPGIQTREAFVRKRIARKIQKNVLFFESSDALPFLKHRAYDDFTQFRSIKDGAVSVFNTDFMLYEGKLLYTSFYGAHEPTAILIEDRALFDMQKSLFESLWKQGKDRTLAFTKSGV